jgi:hypothetical protein
MSNARCLTEGVDVPAVDMVAFLSPKRSRVDIVQATGRAMRRAPGKELGYVLVPLYVELAAGESVEDAVSRADFDEVWDVLQSLQEQDEALAELIRHVGEQKGRGKGFDDRGFADRIDFGGPSLSLENLRSAVTTRCLENLYVSWDEWFGKLVAFKERFGHSNVQAGWKENPALASWVDRQRLRQKKGDLTEEQIRRLENLGFVWDWQSIKGDETWLKWYERMKAFKQQCGHCNPGTYGDDVPLARWAVAQRVRRKKGVLADEQIRRLDELGFVWDFQKVKAQETWMKRYQELEEYVREYGHPHVPRTHSNNKLGNWVWIQRQRKQGTNQRQGALTEEQITLLNGLGFRWDARADQWLESFERLKLFKAKHGHCEVGVEESDDDELASWVRTQRIRYSEGEFSHERQALLDGIGFNWSSEAADRRWREMYDRLKRYQAAHGDADVPAKWKEDPKLASWVGHQRQRHKKGAISREEMELLNELGITWKSRDVGTREDRLAEVAAFKAKHGHCEIPTIFPENPKLGRFVNSTRTKRNSGTLSAERIAKLDAVGFSWASSGKKEHQTVEDGLSLAWKTRFDELIRYKQQYGNCDVPTVWKENREFGNWVRRQRQFKKQGKLQPERIKLLEENGFKWEVTTGEKSWDERFADLLTFKEVHGHCDVPGKYPNNPSLGVWVSNQRSNRKRGELTSDQKKRLNEAGFIWEKKPRSRLSHLL